MTGLRMNLSVMFGLILSGGIVTWILITDGVGFGPRRVGVAHRQHHHEVGLETFALYRRGIGGGIDGAPLA